MKHFKIKIGRKKLSSEYIQSKQNFDSILQKIPTQTHYYKDWSFGSYGIGTIASIALVIGVSWSQKIKHQQQTKATNKELNEIKHQPIHIASVNNIPIRSKDYVVKKDETKQKVEIQNQECAEKITKIETVQYLEAIEENHIVSQEQKELSINHRMHDNNLPIQLSLAGIYQGDIDWNEFNKSKLFINNEQLDVSTFSIQYTSRRGDKTVAVQGNKIPEDVLSELSNIAIDQIIFITNVIAIDQNGVKNYLPPMELKLKFNDRTTQNIKN